MPNLRLAFEGASWDNAILSANAYAYALDRPDIGWGQPGHLNDTNAAWLFGADEITPETMAALLVKDGLTPISSEKALSGDGIHAIALWLSPGRDVQFLRRDAIGTWSYKPGNGPPMYRDSEDQRISDPSKAELYGYGVFVGYFAVPAEGLNYVPKDEYLPEVA